MSRSRREAEATYFCESCEESWDVEGRFDADGDFQPTDEDETNCQECDGVGEFQEARAR